MGKTKINDFDWAMASMSLCLTSPEGNIKTQSLLVSFKVQAEAGLEERDHQGQTPLSLAAQKGENDEIC